MPYIIHVHKQKLTQNTKKTNTDPMIIVRKGKNYQYSNCIKMFVKNKMIYSTHKLKILGLKQRMYC